MTYLNREERLRISQRLIQEDKDRYTKSLKSWRPTDWEKYLPQELPEPTEDEIESHWAGMKEKLNMEYQEELFLEKLESKYLDKYR